MQTPVADASAPGTKAKGSIHATDEPACAPRRIQGSSVGPRRRRPLLSAALIAAGVLVGGAAVAACGGGSSTPGAATGSTTAKTGLVPYARCMRSHGVPKFPDPASTGGIPKQALVSAESGLSTSQVQVAQNHCKHLLPPTGSLSGHPVHQITSEQRQDYLQAAACMRSHGVTDFPDPVFTGGTVEFPELDHLVDLNSPLVKRAYQICQKLIPPGLPYGGSGR